MALRHGKSDGGGSRLSGVQIVGVDPAGTPRQEAQSRFRSP